MTSALMSLGHLLPPEVAHRAAIHGLKLGLFKSQKPRKSLLTQTILGLNFDNPIGIAAGFDKDAEVPLEVLDAGFGFTEVGTITPLPQPGNAKPRIFRLKEYGALINRFGFNSQGHEIAHKRLLETLPRLGPVGVNIGANKTTEDFIADYEKGVEKFTKVADYFTINISSPNTPGLRNLQFGDALKTLLTRLAEAREEAFKQHHKKPPAFLKIAPDLDDAMLDAIVGAFQISGFDGLIVSNTTLERSAVADHLHANETGGLSGRPLVHASTVILAKTRERVGKNVTLIGVGGVHNAQTAIDKIKAGANLVQLYSALTYQGFGLVNEINDGIEQALKVSKHTHISDIVGIDVDYWCSQ